MCNANLALIAYGHLLKVYKTGFDLLIGLTLSNPLEASLII